MVYIRAQIVGSEYGEIYWKCHNDGRVSAENLEDIGSVLNTRAFPSRIGTTAALQLPIKNVVVVDSSLK